MAQQYATDEAGNVWEVDASGNAIRFVSAGQAAPAAVAPNQLKVDAARQDLSNDQLAGRRTAQQIALEAAKTPYAPQMAAAEATKAQTDAEASKIALEKARREAALPVAGVTGQRNLQRAIDDIKRQFAAGPGRTSGIGGLMDYLPTTENQQFDAAGNAVRGFVGPALGLTGGQLNTEKEQQRAVGPYIPQSTDRDAVILDKIRRLQGLADAMAPKGAVTSPADQKRQNDPAAATIGSTPPPSGGNPQGPEGYDVAGVAGGVGGPKGGGGGGFSDAAGLAMAQKLSKAYTAGAGVSDLNKLLRDNGYQEFTDPASIAQINKRGPLNFAPPQVDDRRSTLGRAIGENANSAVGAYAVNAADALTAGNLDSLAGGQTALAQDYISKANPSAALLGSVTGGALAAGGAELGLARAGLSAGRAALAGDALYGGAYGAGSSDDNRLTGALAGAVGGAVGGVGGRAVASGAGRLLRGVDNPNVAALRQAKIPVTVGQTLGGVAKGIEDRMGGLPGLDAVVGARRLEGMQAFNRAGFDEALAPINAGTGGVIGEQGIDAAQAATTQGYRQALDNVNVTREPQFTGEYNAALAQGAQVPRVGPEFEAWAQANLDPLVATPQISGAQIQDFLQQTRSANFGNDAMGDLVGRSVTGAEDAMRGMVQRQSPATIPALGKADQAYRQVQVLRDAVNRARNGTRTGETGIFAPSQLADAAAANAKKYGNSQGTTRQPFFDLTRAAQAVLPNSVPDSGTAGRAVVASGLGLLGGGALGGGAGYASGDTGTGAGTGLALAALLAAGGTKTGQKVLVKALADRPDAFVKAGNKVLRGARYGGIFGAPLIAPISTGIVAQ